MLVLQLLWDDPSTSLTDPQLHFWLERLPRSQPPNTQTHNPTNAVQRHPGARGHGALLRAIGLWLGQPLADRMTRTRRTLLLPTLDGVPIASPELAPSPVDLSKTQWQAWRVPALTLRDPARLLRWLTHAKLPANVALGASAKFWLAANAFVDRLVDERSFAPYAGEDMHTLLARWSPVFDTESSARLRDLASTMPGMCRAGLPLLADPVTHRIPEILPFLLSFIERILDRRARRVMRPQLLPTIALEDKKLPARWLRKLIGPAGSAYLLLRSSEDFDQADVLREWLAPLHVLPEARGRLCLQLDEPANDQTGWRLTYFIQDMDEPSVLIPVGQIWHHQGRDAVIAQRRFINAHQTLLADLGRAAVICPPIADSLRHAAPETVFLTVDQAHEFLSTQAAPLEEANIAVRVPAWWRQQRKLTVQMKMEDREAFFGVQTLVKFNWQVALGDTVISRAEFETLARLKAPLAQVAGQWVEVNTDNLRKALRFFNKHKRGMTLIETLKVASNGAEQELGLSVTAIDVKGELRKLLNRLRGASQIAPVEVAGSFVGELRPYQERGLSWMAFLSEYGLGACLADDMGLGKTVQMLALIEHWRKHDKKFGPVLLICPMSIIGNWMRESNRFAPKLRVLIQHGPQRLLGAELGKAIRTHDLILTTYQLAQRDIALLRQTKWRAVVLDEAQNVKNIDNKQAQAVRLLDTRQRIALTGTPVENRLIELWSILDFLNPGYLGSREQFQRRYARPIERGDPNRADDLKRIVQPFILRRVKTDKSIISDLPNKYEQTVYCNLTREQATLYQAVTRDMLERIANAEGFVRARLILTALTKLKQICNHPAHYLGDSSRLSGRSGKLARLEAMLEEVLSVGEKALIFSQYTGMAGPLHDYLKQKFKREVLYLNGQVSQRKRDEMVWRFQEEPSGPPIFVLSLKAGGTGLNLTAANHVFHYDRWWNPAVENQATDRAFRIGQRRDVQVHKLVCLGTLEERIDQLLQKKRALAEKIIGDGESWLTELSTQQLRDLFAMGAEAEGE